MYHYALIRLTWFSSYCILRQPTIAIFQWARLSITTYSSGSLPREEDIDDAERESRILDVGLALRNYAHVLSLARTEQPVASPVCSGSPSRAQSSTNPQPLDTSPHNGVRREQVVPSLMQNGVPEIEAERIYQIYLREVNVTEPPPLPPRPDWWDGSDRTTSFGNRSASSLS